MSRKYFLNGKVVCKELFLSMHAIANGRLQRVMEKVHKNPNTAPKNGRGKHNKHKIAHNDIQNFSGDDRGFT